MRLTALMLAGSLLTPAAARAEQDALLWTSVTASGPVGNGVLVWLEGQARFGSEPQDFRQYLLRPGLGVALVKGVNAYVGYAYVRSGTTAGLRTEHRIWQQIGYPILDRPDFHLTGRTRLEQRFLPGTGSASWRVRQQLRASAPLRPRGKVAAFVATEGFANLNGPRGASRAGIDRVRLQTGLSFPVANGFALEPGYLSQIIRRRGDDLHDQIAVVNLAIRW